MQKSNSDVFENLIIDRTVPTEYLHLVQQSEYDLIIDIILSYFKGNPGQLKSLTNGVINVNRTTGVIQYSVTNLVRRLVLIDKRDWKKQLYQFFEDEVNVSAYRFFLKDYEHARKHLKVLLKQADFAAGNIGKDIVFIQHLPGTISCLVLHYEHKFIFLQHELIKEWGVSVEELFNEAIANVSKEHLHISVCRLDKELEYIIMMSEQYSAAKMLAIESNFPHLIGEYGTLFSVPANGLVFAAPLHHRKNAIRLLEAFAGITALGYKMEPSPVVNDIFHYHQGDFSSLLGFIESDLPDLYAELKRRKGS